MHELSLMADFMKQLETIAGEQQAQRILVVKVKLGALSHISADHFREHFVEAARGTVAEDARLEIEELKDIHAPNAMDVILESVDLEE